MYVFNSLQVQNWHLFKQARFDFNKGISRIGGDNAVGKSLIFAAIPTIFSLIQKDDMEKPPKGSKLELSYFKDESQIDVLLSTPSSSKYSFALNGADMQPHKASDAKQLLLENWKIPQSLFNSTVFLSSQRDHPLRIGTPGTRSEWLSSALDLTAVYDAYKIEADNHVAQLGRSIDKRQVLEEERDKVASRMPEASISKKKARIAARKLKIANAIYRGLPAQKQRLVSTIEILENMADLLPVDDDLEVVQDKLDKYRVELARLKKQHEAYEEIRETRAHNKRLQAKIDALDVGPLTLKNYSTYVAKLEKMQRIIKSYADAMDDYSAQADTREELRDLKAMTIQTKSQEEAENTLSALVYRATMSQDAREAMEALKPGSKNCPTCGSPVSKKHIKEEREKLDTELRVLPKEIKRLKLEVRYWKLKAIKLAPKPAKPDFTHAEYKTLQAHIKAADDLQRFTQSLRPVEKVKSIKSLDKDIARLEKLVRKYDKLRHAAVMQASYRGMLPEELRDFSLEELETQRETFQHMVANIETEMANCSQVIERYSQINVRYETQQKVLAQHSSTIKRLDSEIEDLQKITSDLAPWKALAEAFGNKGVRLFQLRESAAVLSAQLTELSALFFGATYRFHIEVEPHKLNVMAERNGKVGSLKTMSGFETRSWNLLCAMALLRILPSSLRCDTIILDEIEANMSKHSRERLVRDVIPELATIVPKIVMITPLVSGEMPIQPDYDYRVVKNLVKGEYLSSIISN